ncbi:TetR family transcriptional regulator [Gordonia sp. SID5947]|uniref:TetR/AcrR family transcriptional regulator n=1 Tax=Gordonia sp. SID5947 TaxID=2690315 RepID=UPI00137036D7|nr:TetR/AcrR family transcriptional regulator [Gordonia sp. SID5947]MYR04907.1 TetR family transcriptional regulator [Gordonia sp. SID5947]
MSSPTRWAGVPLTDRRAERRALIVDAAFTVFGRSGAPGLSVRSVCRECELNTRYFYESFADTDELLGALYDVVAQELATVVEKAMASAGPSIRARTTAGIRAVLGFGSGDPRRGRILFTEGRSNPVLVSRRVATQDLLMELVLTETVAAQRLPDGVAGRVGAIMFTGAMAELAQQWLAGHLGDDLDAVVEQAASLVLR